jgi:hypothetical protein
MERPPMKKYTRKLGKVGNEFSYHRFQFLMACKNQRIEGRLLFDFRDNLCLADCASRMEMSVAFILSKRQEKGSATEDERSKQATSS